MPRAPPDNLVLVIPSPRLPTKQFSPVGGTQQNLCSTHVWEWHPHPDAPLILRRRAQKCKSSYDVDFGFISVIKRFQLEVAMKSHRIPFAFLLPRPAVPRGASYGLQ